MKLEEIEIFDPIRGWFISTVVNTQEYNTRYWQTLGFDMDAKLGGRGSLLSFRVNA